MRCGGWWLVLLGLVVGLGVVAGRWETRMQSPFESRLESPAVAGRLSRAAAATDRALAKAAGHGPHLATVRALIAGISERGGEPVYKDNSVDLLIDGPSTYREMLAAIRGAERYIHLETYIFASDSVGQEFADALTERARAGVAVRVLYDAFGSFESSAEFFDGLRAAGVELREYHGFDITSPASVADLNTRDHRKILVVDGSVAFTGGINVSREYSSASGGRRSRDPQTTGWRDTHILIRGPAVAGFQQLFLENWRAQGEDVGPVPDAPAAPRAQGEDLVQIVHAQGGDGEYSAIYHAYLHAMELATERIWITQAYFAPDKRFLDTLRAAARRGVDVRIIVPGVSDVGLVLSASRSHYGSLLSAGVRLYETRDTVLHAKTAVIDGVWSTVGSSNLDYRSFLHNDEVNAVVLGSRFGALMEAQFLEDTKAGKPVLLKDWQDRPIYDRAVGALSRVIEYWL
jgi:cardiolipin synthase A/B